MSLRGAVVGVGYLGQFHAQKYKNNSQVQLVGVCDIFAEQSQKVAQTLGVNAYSNPRDLIGQVDLVTIAASTKSHYEMAKLFLSHGVHVNVEKPITETTTQAKELIELAQKQNLVFTVGHIERFNPSLQELKKRLGSLQSLELIRHGTYKPRGADVSVLHDLMIHDIDMMYWLTGSEVSSFEVKGQKLISSEVDSAQASLVMKNGVKVHISVSRTAPSPERKVKAYEQGRSFYVNSGDLVIETCTIDSTQPSAVKVESAQVEKKDALQAETDAFISAVVQKTQPSLKAEDGLKALDLVEQMMKKISN